MIEWLVQLNPVWQALIATLFTWFVTAVGATTVFFFKEVNRKLLDGMLGFAAGVMIAASFWSLLAPAIEMTRETNDVPIWFPAAFGFLLGGAFIRLIDFFCRIFILGFHRMKRRVCQPDGGGAFYSCWRLPCITFQKDWRSGSPSARSRRIYRPRLSPGRLRSP